MTHRPLGYLVLALAGSLLLVGCGDDGPTGGADGASTSSAANGTDLAYVRATTADHRQSATMAALARSRASSAAVRRLATELGSGHDRDQQMMSGWMDDWRGSGMMSGGMTDGPGMMGPGMMDGHEMMSGDMMDGAMARLGSTTGPRFDQRCLAMMLRHHRAALADAATEQQDGQDPAVVALAARTAETLTDETARIRALQAG